MPGLVIEVDDLIDAAPEDLDRGGTVTIPPLAAERLWVADDHVRRALAPHLSRAAVSRGYDRRAFPPWLL